MAIFQKLILLLHPNLHPFLFDLVTAGIMMVMLVMSFFFVWTLMMYVIHTVELPEPKKMSRPGNPPQMRNDRKMNIFPSKYLLGFRYLEPKFCIQRAAALHAFEEELDRLPTTATFMNLLKLPPCRSAVDKFRRQSAHLEKNGGNYAPMVTLEKKHLYLLRTINQFKKINSSLEEHGGKNIHEGKRAYLQSNVDQYKEKYSRLEENSRKKVHKKKHDSPLRIENPKQIKEIKKNSMYNARVLEVKQKKKRWLTTSCDIELDWYPSSKRLKAEKDVNGTTSCSKNIDEEKCGRRVEEVPDYMEVKPTYMEPEPDYMEVEPMNHSDMLIDSVTRLMNSLSKVEHSECINPPSDMSIDDIENLTMDSNLAEQLNQINVRMDMSVDDIQNLMKGLSLMEHSDHTIDVY